MNNLPVADPDDKNSEPTLATPAANFPTCCKTGGTKAGNFCDFSVNKVPRALFPILLGLLVGFIL